MPYQVKNEKRMRTDYLRDSLRLASTLAPTMKKASHLRGTRKQIHTIGSKARLSTAS